MKKVIKIKTMSKKLCERYLFNFRLFVKTNFYISIISICIYIFVDWWRQKSEMYIMGQEKYLEYNLLKTKFYYLYFNKKKS